MKMMKGSRRGQAMLEYLLVFVSLLAVAAAMTHLVNAARRSSVRTVGLVASDYP